MTLLGFKTILHKKNVGPAKIQRVQQKTPGCWTYVQQNENKFQKVCYCIKNREIEGYKYCIDIKNNISLYEVFIKQTMIIINVVDFLRGLLYSSVL